MNSRLPQNPQQAASYIRSNLNHVIGWGVALAVSSFVSEKAFRDVAFGFVASSLVGLGLRVAVLKDLAPNISYKNIARASSAAGILASAAFAGYGYRTSAASFFSGSSAVPGQAVVLSDLNRLAAQVWTEQLPIDGKNRDFVCYARTAGASAIVVPTPDRWTGAKTSILINSSATAGDGYSVGSSVRGIKVSQTYNGFLSAYFARSTQATLPEATAAKTAFRKIASVCPAAGS